jgi:hypothetical protein
MARRVAHRILVVSPAGPLLEQWRLEMAQRFGLRLEVFDRGRLEEVRRSTELGANPFEHISLGLASIDFLKQERVLDQLERTSMSDVIDEAHHCMDPAWRKSERIPSGAPPSAARRCDLLPSPQRPTMGTTALRPLWLLDPYSLMVGSAPWERYRPHVVRLKSHVRFKRTSSHVR